MYIESIGLIDFRTFARASMDFCFRGRTSTADFPKAKLPNVNVLLGDNGCGKTSVLRAIALAGLGPAVRDAGIFPHSLVRRDRTGPKGKASIDAHLALHPQDRSPSRGLTRPLTGPLTRPLTSSLAGESVSPASDIHSNVTVTLKGDIEQLNHESPNLPAWEGVYGSSSDAFFMVGYGATRRVDRPEDFNLGARSKSSLPRAQRVMGLFQDSYALIPLGSWLPSYESRNKGRYVQVAHLLNRILAKSDYKFTGEFDGADYLFEGRGAKIPFQALSDGYRALIGWVADLLYHVCFTCPDGKKLVDNCGIAMVDEVDLHLHPAWQMRIVESLAKALPNIQFIFTSHSPLVVGSLEWMNVIVMRSRRGAVVAERLTESINGLDADQLLLTDLFGLKTTRSGAKHKQLKALSVGARQGDPKAALELLRAMSKGSEPGRRAA